jgi:hypothetical protein
MNLPTHTWEEVHRAFRRFEHGSHATMVARMLHLVAVLREDTRFAHLHRWVSLASLIFEEAGRCVSIRYSEPGGIAWAGAEGFHVARLQMQDLTTTQELVVQQQDVADAVLTRLTPP